MSLLLAKNNAPTYDYYSEGDGSNPVTSIATLDRTGGTVTSGTESPTHLIATEFNYENIAISFVSEETGINWELSLDNSTWAETINPPNMDALAADQTLQIYARATFANDGSLGTAAYTQPDVEITALEKPVS